MRILLDSAISPAADLDAHVKGMICGFIAHRPWSASELAWSSHHHNTPCSNGLLTTTNLVESVNAHADELVNDDGALVDWRGLAALLF